MTCTQTIRTALAVAVLLVASPARAEGDLLAPSDPAAGTLDRFGETDGLSASPLGSPAAPPDAVVPAPPGPPGPPPAPAQVPLDGGLSALALAGGAYAARRLRRMR